MSENVKKPLYFYHVVNKDVDCSLGLLSLEYMYLHNMFDEFDKNACKYLDRIVDGWNILKYHGRDKNTLTREEIIDALNIVRGENGASYIYFFRFPPYRELGDKIDKLLDVKDIYRIDINDCNTCKYIDKIFYGFDMSNGDNKLLDKSYYENVSREEYFSRYDDSLEMNFSRLNHIGISFKNGYCPIDVLCKLDESSENGNEVE